MASTAKNSIPLCDPDYLIQIPLSDYVKKLDVKVRERYLKKISTIGIDPVLIDGKRFEPDSSPPVESMDLHCYLAFHSLEANNQMVLSFVCNFQGHIIASLWRWQKCGIHST
ncbi:unnamed protein product [Pocillopora meandrina]|uniref:Uncharacterized protein n=1 Tax=Pocillopora meandrina TaxID=46732 RepID=A0AAU9WDD3_9CNID|nr:unnamed protein product [Pocillopora meandrina]